MLGPAVELARGGDAAANAARREARELCHGRVGCSREDFLKSYESMFDFREMKTKIVLVVFTQPVVSHVKQTGSGSDALICSTSHYTGIYAEEEYVI